MSEDFFDRQSHIHEEITEALIHAVPDDWDSAVLELDLFHSGAQCCARLIYHPQGQARSVEASRELIAATDRLIVLFQGCEPVWRRATFGVWRSPGSGWQSTVQLAY